MSRCSSVCIVMGYEFDGQGLIPGMLKDFSLLHSVQTGSEAHPMSIGAFSPAVKWPGCEADHSPPSSAEIKNGGAVSSVLHTSSWRGA
jgi:hypothetical protein